MSAIALTLGLRLARRVAFGLAVATLLGGCQRSERAVLPAAFEEIPLIDQNGQALTASHLSNRTLLVSFMFTSCPVVCPRQTEALVAVRAALPPHVRERVRFISVSVDPENDTAKELKAFAHSHGADTAGWSFVRADEAGTRLLGARLATFEPDVAPTPSAHGTDIYLFDRGGRLVQRYRGAPLEVSRLARELVALDDLNPSGARLASN